MSVSVRRLWRRMLGLGVGDGLWTFAVTVGSKVQTVVALGAAGHMGGEAALSGVVLATSIGILVASVGDLGLSAQVARLYASGACSDPRSALRALRDRWMVGIPAGVAGGIWVGVRYGRDWNGLVLWAVAVAVYAIAYMSAQVLTQLVYGMGEFRGGALLNACVRLSTVPAVLAVAVLGLSPVWIIVSLAAGEAAIAIEQYRRELVRRPRVSGSREPGLGIRETWRLGVGPIANTIMNRSDTALVSVVTSPSAIALYGVSSQVQNAVTTTALVPAGATVVHVARAPEEAAARRLAWGLVRVVLVSYAGLAAGVFVLGPMLMPFVFGVSFSDYLPLGLLLIAGLFSSSGGVGMQALVGMGHASYVARVWICTALVASAALVGGAAIGGAVGAAWGAILRDVVFFVLAWLGVSGKARRFVDG